MFSFSKTLALTLATALTAVAAPTPVNNPGAGLSTTVATWGLAQFYQADGCVNADGSIKPATGSFTNGCSTTFTFVGSAATGYTITSSLGACGFANSVLTCGNGVAAATFALDFTSLNADQFRISYPSGFSIDGSNLVTGKGDSVVAYWGDL